MLVVARRGEGGGITIVEGHWYGWVETPAVESGWAASPVFVKHVRPLKTGHGELELTFLQPVYPGGGREREMTLKVLQRAPRHLAAVFDGGSRTAMIAEPDAGWMISYCQERARRLPPPKPLFVVEDTPSPPADVQAELAALFGRSEAEILRGTQPESFGCKRPPMPKKTSQLMISQEIPSLDSWLIARGATPKAMEDK